MTHPPDKPRELKALSVEAVYDLVKQVINDYYGKLDFKDDGKEYAVEFCKEYGILEPPSSTVALEAISEEAVACLIKSTIYPHLAQWVIEQLIDEISLSASKSIVAKFGTGQAVKWPEKMIPKILSAVVYTEGYNLAIDACKQAYFDAVGNVEEKK